MVKTCEAGLIPHPTRRCPPRRGRWWRACDDPRGGGLVGGGCFGTACPSPGFLVEFLTAVDLGSRELPANSGVMTHSTGTRVKHTQEISGNIALRFLVESVAWEDSLTDVTQTVSRR